MHLLIITPTLGRSPYLDETVNCIQSLAFPVQHILSCPKARISELETRFPQSRVVCDQGNEAGIYGAINAGLAAAQEPWDFFTYLNDDDLLGKDFTALFKRHGVSGHLNTVGFGCISNIDQSGRTVMGMTVGPNVRQYPALLHMGISPTGQQGMVFGRKVVETIGSYTTRYKVCGDLDYWCRAMASGVRFIFYPLEAGRFRVQQGQLSGDTDTTRRELAEIAQIHFPRRVSAFHKRYARLTYRLYNTPRYLQRVLRWGFKSSYQLLESKPQDAV